MTLTALPIFVKLAGRPVILIGKGEAAETKRRLLERAGARIVNEDGAAALAVVALAEPEAVVARLRARSVLVNAVDRPDLCDFTLPAIVDRDPVLIAVGTGGVSAGLAAALRQRLEALLPATLGGLARALHAARPQIRARWPDSADRRRAVGAALAGPLDPLRDGSSAAVTQWLEHADTPAGEVIRIAVRSHDPDELTLREARALAQAERIFHDERVPTAILDRARADALRMSGPPPIDPGAGLSVHLEMGR